MTITKRTIRVSAETSREEFNDIKDFLSNLDDGYYSYVNNYVVAYVLVQNHGNKATKINNVYIDDKTSTVIIDFEYNLEDTKNA